MQQFNSNREKGEAARPGIPESPAPASPLAQSSAPLSVTRPSLADVPSRTEVKKDHRELAQEMKLFMSLDVAPGAPILLPNGLTLYRELETVMENYFRKIGGFQEVRVPALVKASVWEQSGHLAKFSDNMFLFGEGQDLMGLKPMNCPLHMLIFGSETRSYRDLPYRLHDKGILHRRENSGSLLGLTRLIQFHQDDTHIFLKEDQIEAEFERCLKMVNQVYSAFGFTYRACLSTRPEVFLGDEKVWARSEATLEKALKDRKVEYSVDAGGGAFYGPKIGIEIKDNADRWWQLATVQIDFNLPERFNLKYVDADGAHKRPVVLHMALYGAMERFMGIYLEHINGNLPMKFAPQQVRVYPLSDRHTEYTETVRKALNDESIRVVVDDRQSTLGSRLREGRKFRAPYSVVIGDKEIATQTVAVTRRGSRESNSRPLQQFIAQLQAENEFRIA